MCSKSKCGQNPKVVKNKIWPKNSGKKQVVINKKWSKSKCGQNSKVVKNQKL